MMRLKNEEVKAIKDAVAFLDRDAEVYLFGSRVDENKRGGDIDLLVISQKLKSIDSLQILKYLFNYIEEQKIDIVIAKDSMDPFVQIALTTGVKL